MADPARSVIDDEGEFERESDISDSYEERRHGNRPHFYAHAASGRYWQRQHPIFSDEQIRRFYERGRELLLQALHERPLTSISGAFALGYLLGHGMPPALARSFMGVGLRILLQELASVEARP